MQKLNISPNFSLPLDVASQAVGIVGIRGAGKTNTASVLAEELLERGQPIVYIDPTDAAWGLRSGYPVFIFGGSHGDLPLQETDGKVLAEFVVNEQVPIILSLRHLRKGAQRRLVTEFCEEIYHLKGKPANRTPLTIFIDEAPLFVPQRVLGEAARTVGAVEDLIARGRNAGFGVVLISQRPATINKDVLTQCDTIITHRITSPQDRKALQDWIEENATIAKQKEVLQSLATMKDGGAWVWSPRIGIMEQVQIRMRRTFDSSATPKPGEKIKQPKDLASIDLGKLKDKLAASVEKAQLDDPKLLRKKIAELEAQAKAPAIDQAALDDARRRGKIEGYAAAIDALQPMVDRMRTLRSALDEQLGDLLGDLEKWRERQEAASSVSNIPAGIYREGKQPPVRQFPEVGTSNRIYREKPANRGNGKSPPSSDAAIPKGERTILIALAQYPSGCTRDQLSVLTAYKRSSRDTYLQRLRERGYVDVRGDSVLATPAGIDALGSDYEPLPTGAALLQHWLAKLPAGEAMILDLVVSKYPKAADRDWLSEKSGYQRSSRDTYIQRLRSRKLVDAVGRGEVMASEDLF